jgi:hypothetical protein
MVPETEASFDGEIMERASDEFTISVALLLVILPAELPTVTWNVEPLSAVVVAGVE